MITDFARYHREYYYKRRGKMIDYLGGQCAHCGAAEGLEFDHIDPELKSFNISSNLTLSNPEVQDELDKCQLLCRPCHEKKTASENSGWTHGTVYGWMKMKCRCADCSPAWREFHDRRNAERRAATASGGGGEVRGSYNTGPSECGEARNYKRGCRCDECRTANTAHQRKLTELRKAGRAA